MPGQSNSVGRVDDDGSDALDHSPELPSAKECAAAGYQSKKRAASTTSRWMSSWPGSGTSTAMASPACGAPVIKFIATQTFGGADVSRTENRSAASPHRAIPALHLRQ